LRIKVIAATVAAVGGLAVAGCAAQPAAPAASTPAATTSPGTGPTAPATSMPPTTVPPATVPPAPAAPAPEAPATVSAYPRAAPVSLGVYEPSEGNSWADVQAFGEQAGQPVRYVVTYLNASDPFPHRLGQDAAAHGAELILQLEPAMSMARVAAGDDDAYLDSLAAQIRDYGHPVIVSWAAEANGDWYSWGAPHTSITDYRAAWAHVMSRFTGTHHVTWMATINRTYASAAPTSDYVIPGVDMYGVDAYYTFPGDNFQTVFGTTIAQIRAVTDKPIMASETGIGPVAGQVKSIPDLVAGVRANHLAGMVYLNEDQGTGQYHQNWRLSPTALKTLRVALSGMKAD
jgi:mannan endo-1,4-beta-mannosidase